MATEWGLAVVLALGGLGSAAILGLGLAALVQRRSWSYLLVTLALLTLLGRTAVGTVSVVGMLSVPTHHTVEHVLDVLMAALVIAAVYTARSARGAELDRPYGEGGDDD
jgi:hypothetical protein